MLNSILKHHHKAIAFNTLKVEFSFYGNTNFSDHHFVRDNCNISCY
ncbi:MAG: hypothetical protein ACFCAD_12500 [Pleurocapsa sp.]